MKDFLRTADLSHDGLMHLLELAEAFKRDPQLRPDTLAGQIVVLYFAVPLDPGRLSFGAAVARLGGVPIVVGPDELQLGRGESIEDSAAGVISRYAAALVMQTPADDDVRAAAECASIPVVNARTDGHHPCQSLADLLTIREGYRHFAGRKLAYVGDGNSVAHSLLEGAALAGMDISVATPPAYAPSPEVVERAEQLATVSGARIDIVTDPHVAVKDADVVYTEGWLSMADSDAERTDRWLAVAPYRVTAELMREAGADTRFMHCLPTHRGDEVAAEVIDGPCSVVFDQAENRLPTAQALLYALVTGELRGRGSWC